MASTAQARGPPTTPKPATSKPVAVVDSPGTWRHPRLDEIARRQDEATFNQKNIQVISYYLTILAGALAIQFLLHMLKFPQL